MEYSLVDPEDMDQAQLGHSCAFKQFDSSGKI